MVRSPSNHYQNLYNFDETGFRTGQGKAEKIVSAQGNFRNPTGGLSESLTGIECVAADDWVMPPWFLVKGQFDMGNWFIDTNLQDNYTIWQTPNGWTDDIVSFAWVQILMNSRPFVLEKGNSVFF